MHRASIRHKNIYRNGHKIHSFIALIHRDTYSVIHTPMYYCYDSVALQQSGL